MCLLYRRSWTRRSLYSTVLRIHSQLFTTLHHAGRSSVSFDINPGSDLALTAGFFEPIESEASKGIKSRSLVNVGYSNTDLVIREKMRSLSVLILCSTLFSTAKAWGPDSCLFIDLGPTMCISECRSCCAENPSFTPCDDVSQCPILCRLE
ncbi:hypothetical protein SCHPADRAFT_66069 [Schizopora paradoxa]|uniref:Uncharacterized protein n=1 Tax=Schizopora paradoxa TaxID=27342 RepID=A0A0H2S5K6_9AGAM|nr:hypothetical protein SCHPADRAFT_66069 [Schizopora paradoxa]